MELSARGNDRAGKGPPAAGKKGPAGKREIVITLREDFFPREEWKPLAGLPNHRLCRNRIYEIIGEKTLAEIFGASGVRVLEEEGIPLFADTYARIIYLFADGKLQGLLSQDRVFIPEEELTLTLAGLTRFQRGVGTAYGIPAVRHGKKHYAARVLSRKLNKRYIPLGDRWVRRSALENLGLGPLGRYAGGGPIRPIKLKTREALASGAGLEGFWTDFSWEKQAGSGRGEDPGGNPLLSHVEFLRSCGISGGLVIPEPEAAARFLLGYLPHLSRNIEDGRALLLSSRDCFEDFLRKDLPTAEAASRTRTIPVLFTEGGHSVFSPGFRGVGISFYEELPKNPRLPGFPWDILILLRPDRALGDPAAEGLFGELGKIRARLILGIFADGDELFFHPAGEKLRKLFGLRGKGGDIRDTVIRLPGPGTSLPQRGELSPRRLRRCPSPFGKETGQETPVLPSARFRPEAKFSGLPVPEFGAEQELFSREGQRAPYVPCPSGSGGDADFNRLSEAERAYFLYWRGSCRRGRYLPGDPGYIRLYARELILSMGGGAAEGYFQELLALWLNYRKDFSSLDGFFPQWLTDFAVLYGIAGRRVPELLPLAGEGESPLLRDLFLHKRYIEEDHGAAFADLRDLLPRDLAEGVFQGKLSGRGPERQVEIALGGIDRYLRGAWGLRFFEFFYPSYTSPVLIRAFEGLRGVGYSAYTAEWIRFSRHPPLRDFLEVLVRYVLYRLRLASGFERPGREPPLDPLWKYLIDRELGFPGGRRPPELGPEAISLESARVEALRLESDAVRDLLRINAAEEPEFPGSAAPLFLPEKAADLSGGEKPSLAAFLEGLGETERDALGLLLGEGTGEAPSEGDALEALARKNHTMPELILDSINGAFLETYQDLLIESHGGQRRISAEYTADLRACFSAAGV
jgi:hypothetical protein